ncbi:MAG TPA: hypothetical protein PKK85_06725 [Methanobacteriaceae archaeon]|nr:hypothetical protein [Methanobacteriaceae archaeon]
MDELYIWMCREATEIQELRPESSYFPPVKDGEVVSGIMGDRWVSYDTSMEQYRLLLWLPRQEDLQELIIDQTHLIPARILMLIYDEFEFIPVHLPEKSKIGIATLQVFMAVMYNKVWNGTTWETIK